MEPVRESPKALHIRSILRIRWQLPGVGSQPPYGVGGSSGSVGGSCLQDGGRASGEAAVWTLRGGYHPLASWLVLGFIPLINGYHTPLLCSATPLWLHAVLGTGVTVGMTKDTPCPLEPPGQWQKQAFLQ